jgi:hypothetical protein
MKIKYFILATQAQRHKEENEIGINGLCMDFLMIILSDFVSPACLVALEDGTGVKLRSKGYEYNLFHWGCRGG